MVIETAKDLATGMDSRMTAEPSRIGAINRQRPNFACPA
jgi:hypothetical protein